CVSKLLAEVSRTEQGGIVGFFQQPTRQIFLAPLRRFKNFDSGNAIAFLSDDLATPILVLLALQHSLERLAALPIGVFTQGALIRRGAVALHLLSGYQVCQSLPCILTEGLGPHDGDPRI